MPTQATLTPWGRVLLAINLLAATAWIEDGAFSRPVTRTWRPPAGDEVHSPKLRLWVTGDVSPIRFFDLDGDFNVHLSEGGYKVSHGFELNDGHHDYEEYLEKCQVVWEHDRIRFVEPTGYELVIPASQLKLLR